MTQLSDVHIQVLQKYPRAVVHMRAQAAQSRFSLIFGAGLSKPFGIPDWSKLVEEIAADPAIQGQKILERFSGKGSLPYKTELLFQHFRAREAAAQGNTTTGSPEFENITAAKWLKICKEHLYRTAPKDLKKAITNHAYLSRLLPTIQEMPITVTYNFDDFLEQALFIMKDPKDVSLGYETVTSPWTQFSRRKAVIYHPHGMLPQELMEFPRDRLVFSESSYAQLFLGSLAGDFSFLLNHTSKNTCLILGSSLDDEDLRNILIQGAQGNPSNPHYHVYFLRGSDSISSQEADAVRRANFQVYNLITLFLNEAEIGALADLLRAEFIDDSELADALTELDSTSKFHFYLTGPVGVGKSTTTTQLRNLMVLEEWAEPRPALLSKPWNDLTPLEKEETDKWIATQFKVKNNRLRYQKCALALIDRPPMDPLAFTPESERHLKARRLLDVICPKGKWEIEDGVIIFLLGDAKQLAARIATTGREYNAEQLAKMEEDLRSVYTGEGVEFIETRGKSVAEVTKAVSEIIHFREYKPFKIGERLKSIKSAKRRIHEPEKSQA